MNEEEEVLQTYCVDCGNLCRPVVVTIDDCTGFVVSSCCGSEVMTSYERFSEEEE